MSKQKKDEAQPLVNLDERLVAVQPMKNRIRVQFDIGYGGSWHEPKGESQTVPNLSLTIRQVLDRFARNQSSGVVVQKNPIYFETQLPVIEDLTDLDAYKENLKARFDEVEEFQRQQAAALEKEKRDVDARDKIKKRVVIDRKKKGGSRETV